VILMDITSMFYFYFFCF